MDKRIIDGVSKNSYKIYLGVLICVLLIVSCTRQVNNFRWKGVLVNQDSKTPVPYASVYISAYYQKNIDESGHTDYHLIADNIGKFSHYFNKAYLLEVKVEASNHQPYSHTFRTTKKTLPDTIYLLQKEFVNNIDVALDIAGFTKHSPFISVKTTYTNQKKKKSGIIELCGYNFLEHERNSIIYDLNLSFKTNDSIKVCEISTTGKGGIYPVYEGEVTESFFTEIERAPNYGYIKSYRLEGNEVGFFIKCRDGKHHAKVIFDRQLYQLNYYIDQDSIVEQGLKFSYILQQDTNNYKRFPILSQLDTLENEQELLTNLEPCFKQP